MIKRKKKITIVLSIILSVFMIFFINIYFLFIHHYKGNDIVLIWNESDTFSINNTILIEKKKNKDFVILNLADIQLCDLENLFNMQTIFKEISYLVEKTHPDLITLTGDQTWSNENLISLKSLIKKLDSFKIPYAPIFGNHDYGNLKNSAVAELNYCCDLYEHGKYSLFRRGPSNLGTLGNYVINIMEDGKIFKTLYMIDSGYEDMINNQQIAWFKWNAEGIKSINNNQYSEGICFMHKPLPEYGIAYNEYLNGNEKVESNGQVYVKFSTMGSKQNGFFEVAKEKNITDVVCGHQHGNNFTLKYQDIRLTFSLKTGELSSYYDDGIINLNGATTLTISGNNTIIDNHYVDSNQFHIKNSNNCYNG